MIYIEDILRPNNFCGPYKTWRQAKKIWKEIIRYEYKAMKKDRSRSNYILKNYKVIKSPNKRRLRELHRINEARK